LPITKVYGNYDDFTNNLEWTLKVLLLCSNLSGETSADPHITPICGSKDKNLPYYRHNKNYQNFIEISINDH
jgi:hypothetical protein